MLVLGWATLALLALNSVAAPVPQTVPRVSNVKPDTSGQSNPETAGSDQTTQNPGDSQPYQNVQGTEGEPSQGNRVPAPLPQNQDEWTERQAVQDIPGTERNGMSIPSSAASENDFTQRLDRVFVNGAVAGLVGGTVLGAGGMWYKGPKGVLSSRLLKCWGDAVCARDFLSAHLNFLQVGEASCEGTDND